LVFKNVSGGQGPRFFASAAASESDDETEARTPPSEKVERLAEDISTLTLLEVSDLTTLLRQKLGLPAGMGMMMPMGMMPMGGASASAPAVAEEAQVEKTSFDVKLEGFDAAAKIKVIKEVRTFTALGLKEAKELVEKAPVVLKSGVAKDEAEQIIQKLKSVGATALMQ
jgi:large subunit ribosomal protein L7/L12